MRIRSYEENDCPLLAELFYQTIHTINVKDYTEEHLDAWANGQPDLVKWNDSFKKTKL